MSFETALGSKETDDGVGDVAMEAEREELGWGGLVAVTTDDTTAVHAGALVAVLQAHGYQVEQRAFIRHLAEEPRRVVLLAFARPLPALVALVTPPTALPGLGEALIAALYPPPERDAASLTMPPPAALATVQLKAEGAFASISARTGAELMDALQVLAVRVRRAAWAVSQRTDRERRIAYVDGAWYSE